MTLLAKFFSGNPDRDRIYTSLASPLRGQKRAARASRAAHDERATTADSEAAEADLQNAASAAEFEVEEERSVKK